MKDLEKKRIVMRKAYNEGRLILAACEAGLIGKTFREGEMVLDVKESFYKGQEVSEEEYAESLGEAYIANIVGELPVRIAERRGLVDPERVAVIAGVPHAQVLNMNNDA